MIMESCGSACEEGIALSVPCSYRTGVLLRIMMLSNQVPKISFVERHNVLALITDIGYSTNLFDGTIEADEESSENCFVELDEDSFLKSTIEYNIQRNCCSISCQHNCFMSVCREKGNLVRNLFSDEKLSVRKKKLLNHVISQGNVGLPTDEFVILGHTFCVRYLSNLLNISEYVLGKILEDYESGVRTYSHGNRGILKQERGATEGFISWFQWFLKSYGNFAPDEQVTVLPYWLKGIELYLIYKTEASAPHIALSTYYQHLKTYFGPKRHDRSLSCVRFSRYSSHSVCDVCVALNEYIKCSKNEYDLEFARSLKNQHKLDYSRARTSIENLKQAALSFPEDHLFLQCDGRLFHSAVCVIFYIGLN